jgi:hypothetical protein
MKPADVIRHLQGVWELRTDRQRHTGPPAGAVSRSAGAEPPPLSRYAYFLTLYILSEMVGDQYSGMGDTEARCVLG